MRGTLRPAHTSLEKSFLEHAPVHRSVPELDIVSARCFAFHDALFHIVQVLDLMLTKAILLQLLIRGKSMLLHFMMQGIQMLQ